MLLSVLLILGISFQQEEGAGIRYADAILNEALGQVSTSHGFHAIGRFWSVRAEIDPELLQVCRNYDRELWKQVEQEQPTLAELFPQPMARRKQAETEYLREIRVFSQGADRIQTITDPVQGLLAIDWVSGTQGWIANFGKSPQVASVQVETSDVQAAKFQGYAGLIPLEIEALPMLFRWALKNPNACDYSHTSHEDGESVTLTFSFRQLTAQDQVPTDYPVSISTLLGGSVVVELAKPRKAGQGVDVSVTEKDYLQRTVAQVVVRGMGGDGFPFELWRRHHFLSHDLVKTLRMDEYRFRPMTQSELAEPVEWSVFEDARVRDFRYSDAMYEYRFGNGLARSAEEAAHRSRPRQSESER